MESGGTRLITFSQFQRIPHGFQLSGATQHYSPLPLNAATGSNTIPGTTARPAPGGVFIGRNVHSGFAFTTVSGRLSRSHAVLERWKVTAMAEAFGAGTYPASPLPAFGTPTAVGDPRS